jgi:hypothetical protein
MIFNPKSWDKPVSGAWWVRQRFAARGSMAWLWGAFLSRKAIAPWEPGRAFISGNTAEWVAAGA